MQTTLKFLVPILILLNGFFFETTAQSNYQISGKVLDTESGETLIGATVKTSNGKGAITNDFGIFSITSLKREEALSVSFVGYQTKTIKVDASLDSILIITLNPSTEELQVVEIIGQSVTTSHIPNTEKHIFTAEEIKSIPSLFGEADPLKAFQLLPGVQPGADGASGIFVRGGTPDQNLILLDDVPIYNAFHLFGFFSVFNPDAIKSANILKGSFPSKYGGRLSSVIDIRLKDGNTNKLKGDATIGLLSSKLMLEGPISDKTTFMVSGRRTYFDILTKPFTSANLQEGESINTVFYFYDLVGKVTHRFSPKNSVSVSGYFGKDKQFVDRKQIFNDGVNYSKYRSELSWGNATAAVRWQSIWSKKLMSNTTATFTHYDFLDNYLTESYIQDDSTSNISKKINESSLKNYSIKSDFEWFLHPKHTITFGGQLTQQDFSPVIFEVSKYLHQKDTSYINSSKSGFLTSHEAVAYAEDEWSINTNLKVIWGTRWSYYQANGFSFQAFQPRLALTAGLFHNSFLSIKGNISYSRMQQNIHLLANPTTSLPTDLWVPATSFAKPEISDQISAGLDVTFPKTFSLTIGGYYKEMQNLIAYKEGAVSGKLDQWNDKIEIGTGTAYGLETQFKKSQGNTTGWIAYTLSWSLRNFENINQGRTFSHKYDRRHSLNIVVKQRIKKGIHLNASWQWRSGGYVTVPSANVQKSGGSSFNNYKPWRRQYFSEATYYYDQRNNYELPPIHRLDLSASFEKIKAKATRTWNIGVYNAYNQKNPFAVTVKNNSDTPTIETVTLFSILPYVSYNIKW